MQQSVCHHGHVVYNYHDHIHNVKTKIDEELINFHTKLKELASNHTRIYLVDIQDWSPPQNQGLLHIHFFR